MNQAMKIQAAVVVGELEDMGNQTLSSANLSLDGFGTIPVKAGSFQPFLEKGLITKHGNTTYNLEVLLFAVQFEINRRIDAGTFN